MLEKHIAIRWICGRAAIYACPERSRRGRSDGFFHSALRASARRKALKGRCHKTQVRGSNEPLFHGADQGCGAGALVREMIRVSARPSKVPNAPRTRGRAAIHGRVERD